MTGLVVVGAGGFGREVIEIVRAVTASGAADWVVEGVVDDGPTAATQGLLARLDTTLLGSTDWLLGQPPGRAVVIAVGSPAARRAVAARLVPARPAYPVLVHPDATLGRDVELGAGTVIAPGARLSTNVRLGDHVQVDQNATVGHDTAIGDFARLNPQACVSGSVTLGPGCLVGASATVLQGLSVGEGATVGAGSVVTTSVAARTTVKGVPAR